MEQRCPQLFRSSVESLNSSSAADDEEHIREKAPPPALLTAYTLKRAIPVLDWYFDEKHHGGSGFDWNTSLIEKYRRMPLCAAPTSRSSAKPS